MLQIKCLSKCPYFQKPPLPRKIPGDAPASKYSHEKIVLARNNSLMVALDLCILLLFHYSCLSTLFWLSTTRRVLLCEIGWLFTNLSARSFDWNHAQFTFICYVLRSTCRFQKAKISETWYQLHDYGLVETSDNK